MDSVEDRRRASRVSGRGQLRLGASHHVGTRYGTRTDRQGNSRGHRGTGKLRVQDGANNNARETGGTSVTVSSTGENITNRNRCRISPPRTARTPITSTYPSTRDCTVT